MPWQAAPSLIIIMGAFNVAAGLIWSVDRVYYGKVRFDLLFLFVMCCVVFLALRGRSSGGALYFDWMTAVSAVNRYRLMGDIFRSSMDAEYLRAISH